MSRSKCVRVEPKKSESEREREEKITTKKKKKESTFFISEFKRAEPAGFETGGLIGCGNDTFVSNIRFKLRTPSMCCMNPSFYLLKTSYFTLLSNVMRFWIFIL